MPKFMGYTTYQDDTMMLADDGEAVARREVNTARRPTDDGEQSDANMLHANLHTGWYFVATTQQLDAGTVELPPWSHAQMQSAVRLQAMLGPVLQGVKITIEEGEINARYPESAKPLDLRFRTGQKSTTRNAGQCARDIASTINMLNTGIPGEIAVKTDTVGVLQSIAADVMSSLQQD